MTQTDHNGRFPVKYKDDGESRRFQRYQKPVSPKARVPYEDAPPPKNDASVWLLNAFTVLILLALASYGLLVWVTRKHG